MPPGGDHLVVLDTEQVEQIELITVKRTKMNPQQWVKKRGSQVGELYQLKLKIVVLYDDRDSEIHMTQSVGFITAILVSDDG